MKTFYVVDKYSERRVAIILGDDFRHSKEIIRSIILDNYHYKIDEIESYEHNAGGDSILD